MSVRVFDSSEALSEEAAAHVAQLISDSSGPFHFCLSGGSTPKKLYGILASPAYRDSIPWERIHFWWGDERFVPPTDPDSNERMAREAMLDHVPVLSENVHAMYREGTAEDAAKAYESLLRGVTFDLLLLGLGPDAHTASLFPGDPSIDETGRLVVASIGAAGVKQRLTLTPPILNASREVLFLAAGEDKQVPLAHVLNDSYEPHKYPAQIVARNAPSVLWFIDSAAAGGL
ncbi:MAG TPA: 6-phosphogluconolactonase [Fimbriimonas sp.]|nr:6-phosphogluconolactonase [Fimbriimonas sp.]